MGSTGSDKGMMTAAQEPRMAALMGVVCGTLATLAQAVEMAAGGHGVMGLSPIAWGAAIGVAVFVSFLVIARIARKHR